MEARIQLKGDTEANWESANPIILKDELIIIEKTDGSKLFKVGDGTSRYKQLPFYMSESLSNLIFSFDDSLGTAPYTIEFLDDYTDQGDLNTVSTLQTLKASDWVQETDGKYTQTLTVEGLSKLNNMVFIDVASIDDLSYAEWLNSLGPSAQEVKQKGNKLIFTSIKQPSNDINLVIGYTTVNQQKIDEAIKSILAGGTTGQVLQKNSDADFDFSWVTLS